MSDSLKFRQQGNTFYKKALTKGISPAVKKCRLENAMSLYTRALAYTKGNNGDRASAAKNYAKSAQMMAMLYQTFYTKELTQIIYYYKEAFQMFNNALDIGCYCKTNQWREDVLYSYRVCYENLIKFCSEIRRRDSITILVSASVGLKEHFYYYDCMLHISSIWLKEAVTALSVNDFKNSLYALKEMYTPIELIKNRYKSGCDNEICPDILEQALIQEADMTMQMARTESLQAIDLGNSMLQKHLSDSETLNMDLIYEIIDSYRTAMVLTREVEIEVEAIALSNLGKLYGHVLKEKHRALQCFKQCIELAHALTPRVMTAEPWYKIARETVQEYQDESVRSQDEKMYEESRKYLKELEPELKILRDAQSKYKGKDGEFLVHIVSKFPPKRAIDIPEKKRDVRKLNSKELKKLFHKAVLCYHPDKQDVSVNGMKWKVLCGEITKTFTSMYEFYKFL